MTVPCCKRKMGRPAPSIMWFLQLLLLLVASKNPTPATAFVRPLLGSRRHHPSILPMVSSSSSDTTLPKTHPLPPHTFAGMVEQGLKSKFPVETEIERILTSWRLLEMGYEHKQYVGPLELDPNQSNCHQLAPSYVPGLTVQEFWNIDAFPWAKSLQDQYPAIKEEFTRVAVQNAYDLQQQGNNIWAGALTEDASSYGMGWKTLVLRDRGVWDPVNVNLFPKTAQAIHDAGVPTTEVFFASMQPQTDIQPHSDFTNFVLTSHLPLVVPENGNNKCRLTIGDTTQQWLEGELMAFDTSIMHDAINESDETRYILMMRIWHPDLTPVEQEALQFTYDCLQVPELVSPDPGERYLAERQVEAMHAFPEIQKQSSIKSGFGGGSVASGKKNKSKKKQKTKGSGTAKGFGN